MNTISVQRPPRSLKPGARGEPSIGARRSTSLALINTFSFANIPPSKSKERGHLYFGEKGTSVLCVGRSLQMFDITEVMERLGCERPIFHSEADFQHALAWLIHEEMPDCQVRLEFKPLLTERMYLDIWLPSEGAAIKLKYATKKLSIERDGEQFALRDQRAQDIKRYDFIKDIHRLERAVDEFEPATAGFAVLLTNDSSYWKRSPRDDTVDAQFRLHEGRRIKDEMEWSDRASAGTKKDREDPIPLTGSYPPLHWRDYGDESYGRFRYLAVKVS